MGHCTNTGIIEVLLQHATPLNTLIAPSGRLIYHRRHNGVGSCGENGIRLVVYGISAFRENVRCTTLPGGGKTHWSVQTNKEYVVNMFHLL